MIRNNLNKFVTIILQKFGDYLNFYRTYLVPLFFPLWLFSNSGSFFKYFLSNDSQESVHAIEVIKDEVLLLQNNYSDLAKQFHEVLILNVEYLNKINMLETEVHMLKNNIYRMSAEVSKPIVTNPFPDILKITVTPFDVVRFIESSINDPVHYMFLGTVFGIFTVIYYYSADLLEKLDIKPYTKNNNVCYNKHGIPVVQRGCEPKIEKEDIPTVVVTNTEDTVQKQLEENKPFYISDFFDPKYLSFFE